MKRLFTTIFMVLAVAGFALAQRTVTGTIAGDDGDVLIGASVAVKGAVGVGTRTDVNGQYSLKVPAEYNTLVITYTGYQTQEIVLGVSNVQDIIMVSGQVLQEAVVTALGISRYKNELAYSAQKVEGEDLTKTRDANVVNSLAGKVAGLEIKRNNSLGGSTNVVLRGNKSLTGNNQALFVIDGVPIDNSNSNTANQRTGRGGYDYGNAAADINADDVESVTVLKGAAATALYGSRASNGVVMINTKKGRKTKGIGVTINAGMNAGTYDKSTFIEYQDQYGAGYGQYYEDDSGYFLSRDINEDGTDDLVTPTSEDASYGAPFDASKLVYQWDAFDPSSPNFGKATPWVAAANGPASIFETALGTSNSIMIDGSTDKGYFKLGYTKTTDKGIMPNSRIDKDMVNFGASYNLSEKLNVFSSINFTSIDGRGRYGSGYDSKNLMGNFRQWWQTNVDVQDQKAAYERTKQNVTWNWADPTSLSPIYWDNPYWTREENYNTDHRNRYFGYIGFTYNLTSWFDLTGRVSVDQFDEIQEERIAVGSIDVSQYSRFNRNFQEKNFDLIGQFKPFELAQNLKFDALIGGNIRRASTSSIRATTNGGISIPRVYSLANTKNDLIAPNEVSNELQVNGIFAKAGLVYNSWAILDLSIRRDQASSLPEANNSYFYPSASLGLVFSEFFDANKTVTFGKFRLNYAEVGNAAPPLSVADVYDLNPPFDGNGSASLPLTKNNPDLKPERTKGLEAGLEMRFLSDRIGFDVTYYKQNTIDQIYPAAVSRATGFSSKFINAGDVQNTGVELSLYFRPVHTRDFDWRIDLNWARNRNEVLDLGGIQNLQLASFQGGVSINAAVGEPYGTIKGNTFQYLNGEKIVSSTTGRYLFSATSDNIIGNVNPDWIGGVTNTLRYKNLSLSFLIDVKKGGDMFSLDLYYGLATGLYPETAGNNELGNPLRDPVSAGGGLLLPGVRADGTPNTIRASAVNFGLQGYARNPAAAFVYDASFVKLRELNLNYDLPGKVLGGKKYVKGITLGVYGRNLWIIHKNLPYADPEDGLSSGNVQGYQVGSYPTVRTIGANLNVKF